MAPYVDPSEAAQSRTYDFNAFTSGSVPLQNKSSAENHTSGLFLNAYGKEAEFLEVITKLKNLSARHRYPLPNLPQIIVCGSQSSGKSSVLEAITEVPFPRSTGVCTKYATKVTLERKVDGEGMIKMRITPDSGRPKTEIDSLLEFQQDFPASQWRSDALSLMEEAIKEVNQKVFSGSKRDKHWTKDTLSIRISAPEKRPLEVFDLPGLIGHDKERDGSIRLVEEIVEEEMKKMNCLILAVVEGHDDLDKHSILEKCYKYDPKGQRAIVVVTKLDTDSAEPIAPTYINAIQRVDKIYGHRWHVLRNRTQKEIDQQTKNWERDEKEREFFNKPPWDQIDEKFKGIKTLREYLRERLFGMARNVLPDLRRSMEINLDSLHKQLSELGGEGTNLEDLRKVFQSATKRLQNKARDHARGIYEHDITHYDTSNSVNLRSRVNRQNWHFRDCIIQDGQEWECNGNNIVDPDADLKSILDPPAGIPDGLIARNCCPTSTTNGILLEKLEQKAAELLILKAGREIQGTTNPERINDLFWLLSKNWQSMTKDHIEDVYCHCKTYFETITPLMFKRTQYSNQEVDGFHNFEVIAARFVKDHILPGLGKRKTRAIEELNRLEADRRESVQNYDKRYNAEYRQQWNARNFSLAMQAHNKDRKQQVDGKPQNLTADAYASYENQHTQEDRIKFSSKDFVNAAWIHYSIIRQTFITNVAMQVIERHFMRDIESTIDSDWDFEDTMKRLVKTDNDVEEMRADVMNEIEMLRSSLAVLKSIE